jgi:hypothetical protein
LYLYEAYPFFIGLGCYIGGAIFGIIRAKTYHKPGSQATIMPFDGLGIDLASMPDEDIGLKISYAWKF